MLPKLTTLKKYQWEEDVPPKETPYFNRYSYTCPNRLCHKEKTEDAGVVKLDKAVRRGT